MKEQSVFDYTGSDQPRRGQINSDTSMCDLWPALFPLESRHHKVLELG